MPHWCDESRPSSDEGFRSGAVICLGSAVELREIQKLALYEPGQRVHGTALAGPFDHRQRLAVDDGDFEGERIDTLDAAEVDPVAVLGVLAVADVRENSAGLAEVVAQDLLVPEVHAQVARVVLRRAVS